MREPLGELGHGVFGGIAAHGLVVEVKVVPQLLLEDEELIRLLGEQKADGLDVLLDFFEVPLGQLGQKLVGDVLFGLDDLLQALELDSN